MGVEDEDANRVLKMPAKWGGGFEFGKEVE